MKKYILLGVTWIFLGIITSLMIFTYRDKVILVNDFIVEFNSNVKASDFIYYLDGKLINDEVINTTKVGTREVKYYYKNSYGWYKTGTFNIEVVDKDKPIIMVGSSFTVKKGYDKRLEGVILCADEVDDNVSCVIEGDYDFNKVGNYNIKMIATDFSGNQESVNFILKVVSDDSSNNYIGNDGYIKYRDIYKKYKSNNTKIGIDVSKWQGEIDFYRLVNNNVEFIMIKLGGQKEIGGEIEIDPYFYDNIEGALEAGIDVGVYFYSYANNYKESKVQAKYVLDIISDYDITMPVAFDWENWNNYNDFNLSFYNLNGIAKSFISEINKNGYEGVLYSSRSYLESIWYRDDYDIWLANYSSIKYDGDYRMWQVCSDGKVDGISGYVDIDVYYD